VTRILQQLRAAFENLAPRERALVSAVGALFAVTLLWLGLVQPLLDAHESMHQRVASAEQELKLMQRLRRDYDEVSQRLAAVESRIQEGQRGNLRTALESFATEASLKIDSMEPQASPANDRYRETKVEVGLKQVTLPQTVRYLHQIESSQEVLSVKALRIRTRSDQPDLLDVTFTVSSFEPL
jgi:general secretion pathway protein M